MRLVSKPGLAALAVAALEAPLACHAQQPPPVRFSIQVEQPAYTKLPVWLHADLEELYAAHYPYTEDAQDFGPNEIELKRNGSTVPPRPAMHWSAQPSRFSWTRLRATVLTSTSWWSGSKTSTRKTSPATRTTTP